MSIYKNARYGSSQRRYIESSFTAAIVSIEFVQAIYTVQFLADRTLNSFFQQTG